VLIVLTETRRGAVDDARGARQLRARTLDGEFTEAGMIERDEMPSMLELWIGECVGAIHADARTEFAGYADKAANEKKILHDVFAQQIMPVRFLPEVSSEYFAEEQRHEEFAPRTAWSLLNAFTEKAKAMPLTTRIKATQLVGKLFGNLVK